MTGFKVRATKRARWAAAFNPHRKNSGMKQSEENPRGPRRDPALQLVRGALARGAGAAIVRAADIPLDRDFRAACKQNACGYFGRCWACPPDAGNIDELISRIKTFDRAVVFRTVHPLADSYDAEGMREAAASHNRFVRHMQKSAARRFPDCLALGAGGCHGCKTCAKFAGLPCRHPNRQLLSLEACGVSVAELTERSGLPYAGGESTVAYFGIVLF